MDNTFIASSSLFEVEGTKSRFINLHFDYNAKPGQKEKAEENRKVLPKLQIIKTAELVDYMQSPDDFIAKANTMVIDHCRDCGYTENRYNLMGAQNLGPWMMPLPQMMVSQSAQ